MGGTFDSSSAIAPGSRDSGPLELSASGYPDRKQEVAWTERRHRSQEIDLPEILHDLQER